MNQYTGLGFSYNQNGAMTSDGTRSYAYDAANRLLSVDGAMAGYAYDAMGRRFSKTVGAVTTQYVYAGDQVIAEYENGALARSFVYGPGIDEPICMLSGGTSYFYHFDALGSVIALTDAAGALAESYAYTPFGQSNGTSSVGNPYQYTGRRFDDESGLYYYRARYYHPELRRFMQPDPIGYLDGMHVYAYVGNNPVMFVDPYGEFGQIVGGAIGGAIAGGIVGGVSSAISGGSIANGILSGALVGAISGAIAGAVASTGAMGWVSSSANFGFSVSKGLSAGEPAALGFDIGAIASALFGALTSAGPAK